MVETRRTLIYRLMLLAALVFVVMVRPDNVVEIVPVLIALTSSGLATAYTRMPK